MIVCRLSDLKNYLPLLPKADVLAEDLRRLNKEMDTSGKMDISGLIFSVQKGETKDYYPGDFEAHRKYTDIHYMIDGEEMIYYRPVEELETRKEYDEEKDIAWYEGGKDESVCVQIPKGMCCVLFPEDAHMPCRNIGGNRHTYRKVVIKLPYKKE